MAFNMSVFLYRNWQYINVVPICDLNALSEELLLKNILRIHIQWLEQSWTRGQSLVKMMLWQIQDETVFQNNTIRLQNYPKGIL